MKYKGHTIISTYSDYDEIIYYVYFGHTWRATATTLYLAKEIINQLTR